MKILIYLFLIFNITVFANDSSFNIKILNKINLLNYEASQTDNEDLKKRLYEEKEELVKYFLQKLEEGDFTLINNNDQEKMYIDALLELKKAHDSSDNLGVMIAQMKLQIIHMQRSFETLLVTIKEYNNSLKSLKEYKELFVKYSQNMTFANKKYKRVYDKIVKKTQLTPQEYEFLNVYDNYIERQSVYNEIFYVIATRSIKILQTNTVLTSLEIDNLISYFNSLDQLEYLNIKSKEYLQVTIGQIIVSVMFILFVFVFKKIVIDTILLSLNKLFTKKSTEKQTKFNKYIDDSLRSPFRYFLYIVAIDISSRILFMSINNENIVNYFVLFYILTLIWAFFRLINNFVIMYSDNMLKNYPNVRGEMINFFVNFSKTLVVIIGALIILSQMGYDVSAIVASLGIGGLAVAFAARETIANIFGSISVILDNTFTQGDAIVVDGVEGSVVDIGMRSTKIRTYDNSMIYIPNSIMASAKIQNWSKRKIGRRILMHVGATYSSHPDDLRSAVEEIREMLINHPQIASSNFEDDINYSKKMSKVVSAEHEYGILKSLSVHVDQFSSSSIDILIYCFSKSVVKSEWLEVKEDVMYKVMEIFKKNNLSFAFPSQSIYLNNDNDLPLKIAQGAIK